MPSDEARRVEQLRFKAIDAAFRAGDLEALRAAVEDPSAIPNGHMPITIGPCLEYAIYHSPLAFIRTLLELGADVNPLHHDGFPPLHAALSCSHPQPGSPGRRDVVDVLKLLLSSGADPNQRGLNDWTALHSAVAYRNLEAIPVLLAAGANPHLRTRIDDCTTPREDAEAAKLGDFVRMLETAESDPGQFSKRSHGPGADR
jgi:ankyrin repeat protein